MLSRTNRAAGRRLVSQIRAESSALDYSGWLSETSLKRKPSPIRALQPFVNLPGMLSLGGGMPNPATFVVSGLSFESAAGDITLTKEEVNAALQYSPTPGLPALLGWLRGFQAEEHSPRVPVETCVTTGSQDALSKAFAALLNEGDSLLVEEPTYSGSLAFLKPHGVQLVGVPTDAEGMDVDRLGEILDAWDPATQGRKPRVVYTIPTGSNPTGATLSAARRVKLLETADRHDLLVMEDDPYYFLQFAPPADRPASLLSLDTRGRVLRFDSFSKLLSSGLRIGFATGPAPLIRAIELHTQATTLHACGLSQAVTAAVLSRWGHDGLRAHARKVADFYAARCSAFLDAADRHLTGVAEWSRPTAGMFVWFKLLGVRDSFELVTKKCVEENVLLVPGAAFSCSEAPSPFVRASFSTIDEKDMDEALRRLRAALDANA